VTITASVMSPGLQATASAFVLVGGGANANALVVAVSGQDGGEWADAGIYPDGGLFVRWLDAGLPAGLGFANNINIVGPGFTQAITGSQTFYDLKPGSYSVNAGYGEVFDPIVPTLFWPEVSGSPVVVSAGSTSYVSVSYTNYKAMSGRLWLPDCNNGNIDGYTGQELRTAVASVPAAIQPPDLDGGGVLPGVGNCPEAIAFDQSGNAWTANCKANALIGYVAPQYTTQIIIQVKGGTHGSSPTNPCPSTVAFAPNGDLWTANWYDNTLNRYTPSQLVAAGSPTPKAVIETMAVADAGLTGTLANPADLAFDSAGNLWVTNRSSSNASVLVKYSNVSALTTDIAVHPSAVLVSDAGMLFNPNGIAFDPGGALWVTNPETHTITKIANPAAVTGIQPAQVNLTLVDNTGLFQDARNLTFDSQYNLWVFNNGGPLAQLSVTDQSGINQLPHPTMVITDGVPSTDTGRFQFDPPPNNVQLNR
jgi:streptogramin lyase